MEVKEWPTAHNIVFHKSITIESLAPESIDTESDESADSNVNAFVRNLERSHINSRLQDMAQLKKASDVHTIAYQYAWQIQARKLLDMDYRKACGRKQLKSLACKLLHDKISKQMGDDCPSYADLMRLIKIGSHVKKVAYCVGWSALASDQITYVSFRDANWVKVEEGAMELIDSKV